MRGSGRHAVDQRWLCVSVIVPRKRALRKRVQKLAAHAMEAAMCAA